MQKALESAPSHTNLPHWLNILGRAFADRFIHTNNLQDIDHAISYIQTAVESTPSGHVDLPSQLNNLGNSYIYHFKCTGNFQNITHAISHLQKAVESTPSDHADYASYLSNLGMSHSYRFQHTGNLQDIDCAISHMQKALESAPDHTGLPHGLTNLGKAFGERFKHTRNLQDIDHAIFHHQKAVESTPPDHASLPRQLSNLGNSYFDRFNYTGDLQDIDCAIFYHQKAVESTPFDNLNLPSYLSNLGNAYVSHFKHTGNLHDIDYAISYHQKAVGSISSDHADFPSLLNNLGNSYLGRFEHTGNLQDIDYAISHYQKAMEFTPSYIDFPACFTNLGTSYGCRFGHTGDLQDIDYAISHYLTAVKSIPSGHADLPSLLNSLGKAYSDRFQSTNCLSDIQKSIAFYRQSAQANGPPSTRLHSAQKAAIQSFTHDNSQCLNDFALAISLLSEVAGLEQTIHHRHAKIHGYSGFMHFAVHLALHYNRSDWALEWLEQGRCLVWNQLNQLRTPIDNLHVRSSSLADCFVKVARALESYGARSSSIISPDSTLTEHIYVQDSTHNHTMLAAEYAQLLKEIRGLPDFHDFLQLPNAINLLSSLPSDGPVIIFIAVESQCDALALICGIKEPLHIPLENFSLVEAEKLHKMLQSDLLKQREAEDRDRAGHPCAFPNLHFIFVLKELWDKVVHPVLKALGYPVSSTDH